MQSFVLWCEFIDLVSLFGRYCLTPVTLFIIRSKGSMHRKTAGGPDLIYSKAVCGPKTHRIAEFFDQRQTSIIADWVSLFS